MEIVEVAVIPGDGIGQEVIKEGLKVLETAAEVDGGIKFNFIFFPWSCRYFLEKGEMMPKDGLQILSEFKCILLGAVGVPGTVPDHISLWGLLLPIRRGFDQYINLRPCRLLRGMESRLRDVIPGDIDITFIRENTEGEYSNMGGRIHSGSFYELAVQNTVFTRMGVERVIKYAFQLASKSKRRRLTGATKSNGINHTMPFWDEIFRETAKGYPGVSANLRHIDALCADLLLNPSSFDVIVASNLFGDILTDLAAAIIGSVGMAPSANINPEGRYPSMFEPVHGSAPDIAGKGIANPIGEIWTVKLLLDHLGKGELGDLVLNAIEEVLISGVKTPDLGGEAKTYQVGEAICATMRKLSNA